ncbi:hypothetical protein B0H17DRAFT_1215819 [Mycena rosella]|uniref:Uncharacterized protein n=1 Tax=Mycena rosella TaxID=1033263 RepID=A0AAD7CDL5_MYCRO|nr:hypothetical protein B0H17DRAFT_1215819 [Mycena rosella]
MDVDVFVRLIYCTLRVATSDSIPPGYLFLCPLEDLQADSPSRFRLPECPAYWSLDQSGAERLSIEEAEKLGFPSLELEVEVTGCSWDNSVYTGIRQFHRAKGFDSDSQDVARKLGLPLFEISTEVGGPFAHIEETDLDDYQPETQETQASELPQEPVHGESGMPDQPLVTSASAAAHPMVSFGTYAQVSAIDHSFDPHLFRSAAPTARSSHNFNFEFPFHDQPYALPPLESSTPIQFTPLAIAGSSINYSGPSHTQFRTPPLSLWTSFPRHPPIPAPSSPSRLPNPIAAHLYHLATSRSGKRESRDDDPGDDIAIDARRPRKMPKRADLWRHTTTIDDGISPVNYLYSMGGDDQLAATAIMVQQGLDIDAASVSITVGIRHVDRLGRISEPSTDSPSSAAIKGKTGRLEPKAKKVAAASTATLEMDPEYTGQEQDEHGAEQR